MPLALDVTHWWCHTEYLKNTSVSLFRSNGNIYCITHYKGTYSCLATLDVTQTNYITSILGDMLAVARCDTLRLGGVIPNPKGVRESLYFSNGSYMIIKPYEICLPTLYVRYKLSWVALLTMFANQFC